MRRGDWKGKGGGQSKGVEKGLQGRGIQVKGRLDGNGEWKRREGMGGERTDQRKGGDGMREEGM